MGLTEFHRERRRKYLGASDVAKVLGISPFEGCTASDVYYSKTAEFEETEDKPNSAMQTGNFLESSVLDFAASQLGKIKRNQFRVHPNNKWAAATLDAMVIGKPEGVEAKTTGRSDNWGEESTDQIPVYYIAQCQWQMWVADLDRVWVPVCLPDFGLKLKMYSVDRDQELINRIVDQCSDFWNNNVLAGVPPPKTTPSTSTLKRIKRKPEKVVDVSADLVEEWMSSKAELTAARERERECRARLIENLGDAEAGRYHSGVITYTQAYRKGYQVKPTQYRTLKVGLDGPAG